MNEQEAVDIPERVLAIGATIEPNTPNWRLQVAAFAHKFFSLQHSETAARWIGKTLKPNVVDPWAVIDFLHYLTKIGVRTAGGGEDITPILGAMERAGLLIAAGWHPEFTLLGQQYISQHVPSIQKNGEGVLWLSEVLGAELIIPEYQKATALVYATDSEGHPAGGAGTGLVLDSRHLITNKHVIEELAALGGGIGIYLPGVRPGRDTGALELRVKCHNDLDVAVIETAADTFFPIDGLAFRDPEWSDEVYVFGYPRVPMTAESVITVQRGEVVNPATETPATVDAARQKIFLYSAIARPGNSGGPIVAHDGCVIGLVVETSSASANSSVARSHSLTQSPEGRVGELERKVENLEAQVSAGTFYRGIPASEIMRVLTDFGIRAAAKFVNVDPPDKGPNGIATVHFGEVAE
ncbi:hypothetical protein MycrhDRAFT_4246 [Mycolicibacterium rhodesiae JS60]|nr:hypothetical protein MycrhDRAFT_4246 [Mycolicibacterium rhodesiae JS60]